MEYKLFIENLHKELQNKLNMCKDILCEKELKYRKDKLKDAYFDSVAKNEASDVFYSLVHQIKTMFFLKNIGKVKISMDSKGEPGPDFTYLDRYRIECVNCTPGTDENLEKYFDDLKKYNVRVNDYNERFRRIALRFTTAIKEKKDKYEKYLRDGHIKNDEPYGIFLSIGRLRYGFFPGDLGNQFTRILVGRGYKQIQVDSNGKQVGQASFGFIPFIKNNNDSSVDTNIFSNSEYRGISTVIVTWAYIDEDYNSSNTVIFLNPLSKNKIKIRDFWKLPYWKINDKFNYIPRIKGKEQKINMW